MRSRDWAGRHPRTSLAVVGSVVLGALVNDGVRLHGARARVGAHAWDRGVLVGVVVAVAAAAVCWCARSWLRDPHRAGPFLVAIVLGVPFIATHGHHSDQPPIASSLDVTALVFFDLGFLTLVAVLAAAALRSWRRRRAVSTARLDGHPCAGPAQVHEVGRHEHGRRHEMAAECRCGWRSEPRHGRNAARAALADAYAHTANVLPDSLPAAPVPPAVS